MNFSTSLSALNVAGVGMQVTANNIANVNTDGFRSSTTVFQSGQNDQGVQVAAIYKDGRNTAWRVDNSVVRSGELSKERELSDVRYNQQVESYRDKFYTEYSNTDLAREFTNMISLEAMYSANAAAVRTQDEMTGTLVNMVI